MQTSLKTNMEEMLEVRPNEFPYRESEIHGRSHIHRVMFWTRKICIAQGLQTLIPDTLCAARLHDLARKHDGECLVHGAHAAAMLPDFVELFQRLGATDMDAIGYAVAIHCLPVPLDKRHPHFLTAAVLRDADALDRFRLGPEGPKLEYLNFERTAHFLNWAKELTEATLPNETPWETIQRIGGEISNPAKGFASKVRGDHDVAEPPRKRRNRRLLQGKFAGEMRRLLDNLETVSITAELQKAAKIAAHPVRTEILGAISTAQEFARHFIPVTYIKRENLNRFLQTGEMKGLWELPSPTWHTSFSESPEEALDARAYNDARLWGEKGTRITYGALVLPEDTQTDGALRRMYGECRIVWKPEVLASATFCMNDSQESPFCIPYEVFEEAVVRMLLHKITGGKPAAHTALIKCNNPFPPKRFHFFEIQIHRGLTPAEMVRQD